MVSCAEQGKLHKPLIKMPSVPRGTPDVVKTDLDQCIEDRDYWRSRPVSGVIYVNDTFPGKGWDSTADVSWDSE